MRQMQAKAAPKPSFTPVPIGLLQRQCVCGGSVSMAGECAECSHKKLSRQRSAVHNAEPVAVPPIVHEVLRSPGQPLDPTARAFMESHFSHDFSQVRVHTDAQAAKSARTVNALAYTVGRDIVFESQQYQPETREGRRLLTHELTHVAQQNHGAHSMNVNRYEDAHSPAEQEADVISDRVASGKCAGPLSNKAIGSIVMKDDKPAAPPESEAEEAWEKDENGKLYYKTKKEAERRKKKLEEAGEWSEYRVTSFQIKDTTYWRVEMRGRKQAPSPPPGQQPGTSAPTSPPTTSGGASTGVKRVFSLTFDDGPHSATLGKGTNRTEKVLDTLKAKGVQGGFFIQTGVSFRGASSVGKALVARMHKEGHKVGIHTGGTKDHESHPSAESAGRLSGELTAAKTYIKTETGETPTLVRPPFGASNKAVESVYKSLSLTNVLWDIDGDKGASNLAALKKRIDSSNAKDPGIPAIQARGWTGTTPSSPKIVILYHDIRQGTADNIGDIIDHIKSVTSTESGGKDSADFAPP